MTEEIAMVGVAVAATVVGHPITTVGVSVVEIETFGEQLITNNNPPF